MNLDGDELSVLIEALDAWVNKDAAGELMGEVASMLLAPPDKKDEAKRDLESSRVPQKEQRTLRKERAILIQAKLLQMRDGLVAETALPSTINPVD